MDAQDRLSTGLAHADTFRVDGSGSLRIAPFVVPGSVRLMVAGEALDHSLWTVKEAEGLVQVEPGTLPVGTIVTVRYRAFPLAVGPVFRLNRLPLPVPERTRSVSSRPRDQGQPSTLSGLRSRGAITRGVTAGSGRDVSIESGLRLEVEGSPAPGVDVRAVLTDESTPIRPDGTTQRLSEFDRVAVEISGRPGRVELGDIDVVLARGRFSRFRRKVQGVSLRSSAMGDGTGPASLSVVATGAAARGLFHVQRVVPVDGLQGPYRLEGRNGELFVLVIPGSETVYLDGERLVRGATRDYTIDYATAELTFVPSRTISADRRIEVEFTYTINQFTRTIVATEAQAGFWPSADGQPRATVGISWLREADGGQFADEFGLSSADSLQLSGAGDTDAFRSGAAAVPFDPEAPYVQYRQELRAGPGGQMDTVYSVLESAPLGAETVYRVQFSRVGSGKGSYVREGQSVNGIVYAYRGRGEGEYEPVRRLPRPELRTLFDLRGGVRPAPGISLEAEWARSLNDMNRLSSLDRADDVGDAYAGRLSLSPSTRILYGRMSAYAEIVRRAAHFVTFDRMRAVEFGREWNLGRRAVDATGTIVDSGYETEETAGMTWSGGDSSGVSVRVGRLTLGDAFEGTRLQADGRSYERGRPGIRYAVHVVGTDEVEWSERGRWIYHRGRLDGVDSWRVRPYLELEREVRHQRTDGDTLDATSIRYLEVRPGVTWSASRASVSAEVERRQEDWPVATRLDHAATSWTARLRGRFEPYADWSTSGEVAWRRRSFDRDFAGRPDAGDTRSLAITWSGDGRPRASRVRVGWLYQARTERSPTLQEVYFRAGPERGEFVWVDDNGDGVIQVDEFVPETTPDEGLYVRTYLPSDSLVSVTVAKARVRVALDPAPSTGSWLGFLSGQTLLEVEERSRTNRRADVYLLRLDRFRTAGSTMNGRMRVRQDLSLFRGDPRFGLDAAGEVSRSLSELAAGIESRRLDRVQLGLRGRPAARWDLGLDVVRERNATDSDAFASRQYDLMTTRVAPSIRFRWSSVSSGRIEFVVARKRDRRVLRSATLMRIPLSLRTGLRRLADLQLRLELSDARVTGAATGLAAWELTDGRGEGTSVLWGATFQWSISRTLRATVAYDGRAPSTGRVIHTGRIEVSALF